METEREERRETLLIMQSETRQDVLAFRQARNWPATDTLENLTAALAEEAGELSEYIDTPDSPVGRKKQNREVGLAAADVAIYLIALCEHLDINLEQAVRSKMGLLDEKYPTEIDRSKLILMRDGPFASGYIPIEHLLELWGDYDIVDWNEVAEDLGYLEKEIIFERWHWDAIVTISRNLERWDRHGIRRVIESGISDAMAELLTYELDLRQEEIDLIRATLKADELAERKRQLANELSDESEISASD